MLWETRGEETEHGKRNYRLLLQHPHSFHISKAITRGLKTERPIIVSLAMSHIYEYATENVGLCGVYEPDEFFGLAKDSYDWSKHITNTAFWAFTYRAFHARALFLSTTSDPEKRKAKQPLVQALDDFKEAFFEYYPVKPEELDEEVGVTGLANQEEIERVEDELYLNKSFREKYFPPHLTSPASEGDGTDKLFTKFKRLRANYSQPPPDSSELDLSKVPDHELFFYDTQCKSTHQDVFKNAPTSSKSDSAAASNDKALGPVESKRSYDAFSEYRESGADADDEEPEEGREAQEAEAEAQEADDEDDAMGGIGGPEEIPDVKKLKISDD
ncbi:hypothetical protein F4821DRAFT_256723 [Hypoxylon rubiginosum]|uniref:Uncharacterized protein n=1 Tax=Hypoxylon rubiginosum TaxID=110542 RepID=A0ACC0DB36_9PEZI|nr:hypothetical protein F4821DRAFT_256723 [Hypoxylon rubiginosum]